METNERFEYIVSTLIKFRKLWIIPAIAGALLAGVYALFLKSDVWTARQTIIVRDDMLGQSFKPGQFQSQESMKSAQETILEIARKPDVISNALKKLGSPSMMSGSSWPSEKVVEQVQGHVSFSAPNGAEFGKTEVIILNAKASTRERSREFIGYLMTEMDRKLSEVRALRLESMESELAEARDAAARSLEQSTQVLREMEGVLGADVGTMTGLTSNMGADGIKQELSQLKLEKRVVQAELDSALTTQEELVVAKLNPEKMLAASSDFLRSQPTLQALQNSLVDAQKAYAANYGRYEQAHPIVQSSMETIYAMREQIYMELDTLSRSNESHITTLRQKIRRLGEFETAEITRLTKLGSKRVDHLTINSEVAKKQEVLLATQSRLAEIQAQRFASENVNWLTRVDAPQVSTKPDGLGKKAMVMGGGLVGLMMGLGLVMLVAPPMPEQDKSRPGRRTDRLTTTHDQRTTVQPAALEEMVGPTAANAIHSASAATSATFAKGVEMARNAMGKPSAKDSANAAIEGASPASTSISSGKDGMKITRREQPETTNTESQTPASSIEPSDLVQELRQQAMRKDSPVEPQPVAEQSSKPGLSIRRSSVRPVDLAKSATEESSTFVATEDGTESKGSDKAIDQFMANESVVNEGTADQPISDQIQKLSDSISNFAKPVSPREKAGTDTF